VTTWILNRIFSRHFSDIHCGMRGITKDALDRMGLRSVSWEYASEMIVKSAHMKLRTDEVPIRFLKDREGRTSHHKRSGWFSPWAAAWINLRAMFVYGAAFFLYRPGIVLAMLGALLTLPLSFGPVKIGPVTFSLHWMLLGLTLTTLGLQCVYLGILAKVIYDYRGDETRVWLRRFAYTRTVLVSAAMFASGIFLTAWLARTYVRNGLVLDPNMVENYLGVTGLLFMVAAFMTFTFTLLLHATALVVERRSGSPWR
jgi:hypothetical protein